MTTPYSSAHHRTACDNIVTAQDQRIAAGLDAELDGRAVESMAPEGYGAPRERFDTVLNRARLAAVAVRSDIRRGDWSAALPPEGWTL